MNHIVKNVFIAGGTGFLGYYSALQFMKKGANVSTIALDENINEKDWYPAEISTCYGDLFSMSEDEIFELLKGKDYDTFVYALGPDDRITPKAPASDFFYERLVVQCLKICRAAKRANIRRCVIMNSYFTYFDRIQNGKLSAHHPYIKCRIEQAEAIIGLGVAGEFDVMIIELPYIFGEMPGRIPIWKDVFVERFKKMPAIFFPNGGTTAIHVTGVAQCIVAAAYNGENGKHYLPASINIKFSKMIKFMMASAGFPKRFIKIPAFIGYFAGLILIAKDKKHGVQSGLHMAKIMTDILSQDFFADCEKVKLELNYNELGFDGGENVWTGIKEAM
ncbi:MAG: NAD(P)-dependent oxidoreductase, partial [Bacteroidales bacterium]|nr:NAD(P)-dependent oxidoreductase [Bacteroidales bacterium]